MPQPTPRRLLPAVPAVLLLAGLLGAAAAGNAAEPEEPTGPPAERIAAHMDRLRGQLQNVKMRLTNGIVAVDATHDGVASGGPVIRCCAQNLPRMERAIRGVDGAVRELAACHLAASNEDARPALELARFDLDGLVSALRSLSRTTSDGEALAVLGGTTRAFLNLEKSLDALPECADASGGASSAPEPAPGS